MRSQIKQNLQLNSEYINQELQQIDPNAMALTINTNRSQRSGSKMSVTKASPRASIEKIQTTGFDVSEFDHLRDADRTIEEP